MAEGSTEIEKSEASEGIGERSVSGALARLLALTTDAVMIFDGAGRVLLANDEASELFGRGRATMAGADVRTFFPPAPGIVPDEPFDAKALPFALDGRATHVMCASGDGRLSEVVVRADRVSAPGETYLLVVSPARGADAAEREHDRLLEELQRANHRLSGTLDIVLSTIDSEDVGTLFGNVIEEITNTMEASGTLLYLAEGEGLRLYGTGAATAGARLPKFIKSRRDVEQLATESGGALRYRVLEPGRDDLRRGRLATREVIDEDTRQVRRVPARRLPPFTSFIVAPVWFGGYVISVIIVGWEHARQTRRDDARLIDAVGRYLSVQLAGALSTLRHQRTAELADLEADLRDLLLDIAERDAGQAAGDASADSLDTIAARLSQALSCHVAPVWENRFQTETVVARLPVGGERDLPMGLDQIEATGRRNELQQVAGVTAHGIYSSATQSAFVGGDFYDLIRLPGRRACVIMGDVSGKGVEAASVSAAVKTALGAYSWEGLRPARMVRLLNDFLLGFSRLETFATLFVGIVDLGAGRLTYCSAGHPSAILVHAKSDELVTLDVQSGVVGAFPDMNYRNGQIEIGVGDILLLYTDGTTEARAPGGAFFGEAGLRDAVMQELPRGYDGLLDRLLSRLDEFTGRHLDDDVAMVSLRFDQVGQEA